MPFVPRPMNPLACRPDFLNLYFFAANNNRARWEANISAENNQRWCSRAGEALAEVLRQSVQYQGGSSLQAVSSHLMKIGFRSPMTTTRARTATLTSTNTHLERSCQYFRCTGGTLVHQNSQRTVGIQRSPVRRVDVAHALAVRY